MELVSKGTMNLFEFYKKEQQVFVVEKEKAFYQLNETSAQGVKSLKYKGILSYLVDGCADAKSKVNRMEFSRAELQDVVYRYNKCFGAHQKKIKKKISGFTEIQAGVNLNKSRIESLNFYEGVEQHAAIGWQGRITWSFLIGERTLLSTGAQYHQQNSTVKDYQDPNSSTVYNADFNMSLVGIPFRISQLLWRRGNLQVGLQAGADFSYLLQESYVETWSLSSRAETKKIGLDPRAYAVNGGAFLAFKNFTLSGLVYKGSLFNSPQRVVTTTGIEMCLGYRFLSF